MYYLGRRFSQYLKNLLELSSLNRTALNSVDILNSQLNYVQI